MNQQANASCLLAALPSVAFAAEHLAVGGNGAPTFHPWRYMVGFHLLNLEVSSANGAYTLLPLIDLALGIVVKRPDAQVADVVVEDIVEDAGLLLHITILHQISDLHADGRSR